MCYEPTFIDKIVLKRVGHNFTIIFHYITLVNALSNIKVIVHPKMKVLPSFTCPQITPNLYKFLFFCSKKYILKNVGTVDAIDFHTVTVWL